MAKYPIKKAENGTYYFRANLGYHPVTGKSIREIGKFSWCPQNQNSCPETFACFPAYQHGRKSTAD